MRSLAANLSLTDHAIRFLALFLLSDTTAREQLRNDERERRRQRGLVVSASRMGLLESFTLHWAECAVGHIRISISVLWLTTYHMHTDADAVAASHCCRGCESRYIYSACRSVKCTITNGFITA